MVVDWTGKPSREGDWVCAIRATGSTVYHTFILYVRKTPIGELYGTVKDDMFNVKSFPVDDLFEHHNVMYGFTCQCEVKCSTTPIQIDNVNWDYKVQQGD